MTHRKGYWQRMPCETRDLERSGAKQEKNCWRP